MGPVLKQCLSFSQLKDGHVMAELSIQNTLKNYTGYIFIEWNLVFSNSKFWNFFQQKLKEEREAKRAQLDGRHDYILSIVASCLGLEKADVEDAILEGNQVFCT